MKKRLKRRAVAKRFKKYKLPIFKKMMLFAKNNQYVVNILLPARVQLILCNSIKEKNEP